AGDVGVANAVLDPFRGGSCQRVRGRLLAMQGRDGDGRHQASEQRREHDPHDRDRDQELREGDAFLTLEDVSTQRFPSHPIVTLDETLMFCATMAFAVSEALPVASVTWIELGT